MGRLRGRGREGRAGAALHTLQDRYYVRRNQLKPIRAGFGGALVRRGARRREAAQPLAQARLLSAVVVGSGSRSFVASRSGSSILFNRVRMSPRQRALAAHAVVGRAVALWARGVGIVWVASIGNAFTQRGGGGQRADSGQAASALNGFRRAGDRTGECRNCLLALCCLSEGPARWAPELLASVLQNASSCGRRHSLYLSVCWLTYVSVRVALCPGYTCKFTSARMGRRHNCGCIRVATLPERLGNFAFLGITSRHCPRDSAAAAPSI